MNDPTPIGADPVYVKKEDSRKAKVTTGKTVHYLLNIKGM